MARPSGYQVNREPQRGRDHLYVFGDIGAPKVQSADMSQTGRVVAAPGPVILARQATWEKELSGACVGRSQFAESSPAAG
jgi:hypothetical protein